MPRIRMCAFAIAAILLGLPGAALADTFTGTLNVVWGDPKDRSLSAGGVQYILATPDGRYVPMQVASGTNSVLPFNGRPVVVTGQLASQPRVAGTAGEPAIVVESIALDPSAPARSGPAVVSGTRKVLFLLLKFQDDATEARPDPHAAGFYTDMTNPDTPPGGSLFPTTINGFFKKTSNNVFSWIADVGGVGGIGGTVWITLPHPKSYYANCGFSSSCFNFSLFDADALAAATSNGISFTPYDNLNFVISNDLDCCAWGGPVTFGAKTYGGTWEPPWGQETSVYSHEMGHSIGLPHSGWVYHAYDSPWDVMSDDAAAASLNCGSYYSRNGAATTTLYCNEPGSGYIMAHRDVLGWIPAGNQVTVPVGGALTTTIEGGALPISAGVYKFIKICITGYSCTGTSAGTRYFTVEARVKNLGSTSQYDNGIPGEGIVIHDVDFGRGPISGACFFNSQSGWAVPIDAMPGDYVGSPTCSGPGLSNAQFTPGTSYVNSTYHFKVSVNSRSGSTFNITVTSPFGLPPGDFDADVKADMTLYKSNGDWAILKSSSSYTAATIVNAGGAGYVAVPGDYDGDGRQDPAVYNTTTGQWVALKSSTNYTTSFIQSWGGTGYLPVPGDYDGDGKTDPAIYVQSTGQWLVLKSSTGYATTINISWGGAGYTAVPGRDFDGDGKADFAIYNETTGHWYILKSTTAYSTSLNINWGGHGYTLVPGYYDGDALADPALYERATGRWLVLKSSTNYTTTMNISWGGPGYDPVPADYDGDGKFDPAIVQRSTGNWYVLRSSASYASSFTVTGWGLPADMLVTGAVMPVGNDTRRASDFDGDGRADITVYNSSAGAWDTLTSATNYTYASAIVRSWGGSAYLPVTGDFDGDGRTDYGLYVATTGAWSILLSGAGYTTTLSASAGGGAYTPAVGDYDGDGKSDIGVYNNASGNWFVLKSSTNFTTTMSISWGGAGYSPAPGDYDGDGKTDLGIYQSATGLWTILLSSSNYTTTLTRNAGGTGYVPVQGDYDGDGKADLVVYNSTTGLWFGLKSSTNYTTTISVSWGGTGYLPIRADFDGDGKIDLGLYQGTTGDWSILLSSTGYTTAIVKNWGGSAYGAVPYP